MEDKTAVALMQQLIDEGKKVIFPEKIDNWISYINSTKGNMESLHEVSIALTIIGLLNYGADMDSVISLLNNKECPIRVSVVRAIVANYCIRGPEFFEKTATEPLPEGNITFLENLKRQNTRLSFIHSMRDAGYEVEELENGPILVKTSGLSDEDVKLNRKKDE